MTNAITTKTAVAKYLKGEPITPPITNTYGLVNGIYPGIFDDFVGQNEARRKAEFYLGSYQNRRLIPNCLLTGQKGDGKTTLARVMAKGLYKFNDDGTPEINTETNRPRRKKILEINCSTLTTVSAFINGFCIPKVQDNDVTLIFDEASEIPRPIAFSLLTILAPNAIQTSFEHDDYRVEFDFRKQSWLFCTAEPNKIYHALLDRLQGNRIDLRSYTVQELAQIIQKESPEIQYDKGVLESISSVARGNARNGAYLASEIKTFLGGDKGVFTMKNWNSLKEILSINPLGLSISEIALLRHLESNPSGITLTGLSAKMGLTRSTIQRETETYPQKLGLMTIEGIKGRVLTAKGLEYIRAL